LSALSFCVLLFAALPAWSDVSFQEAAAGSGSTGTSGKNCDLPTTDLAAGDLFLMHFGYRSSGLTPQTPDGWTLLFGPDSFSTSVFHYTFGRIATGSESGQVAVITNGDTATLKVCRVYRFRGTATSNYTESATHASGGTDTVTAPAVTTSEDGGMAVALVYIGDDDSAIGEFSGESGGEWDEVVEEYATSSGADALLQIQIAAMASAGTITGGSATLAASEPWTVRGFGLKPLGEAPPSTRRPTPPVFFP
jgi:hypothetical protein